MTLIHLPDARWELLRDAWKEIMMDKLWQSCVCHPARTWVSAEGAKASGIKHYVVLFAVLMMMGLSGCGAQYRGLPSLAESSTSAVANADPDLVGIAKAYFDCMVEAGFAVEVRGNWNGEPAVVELKDYRWYVVHEIDGMNQGTYVDDLTVGELADVDEAMSLKGSRGLVIDGVDRSEPYLACLAQTGYDEEMAWDMDDSDDTDPVVERAQVDANNRWAACARDHGFTQIADTSSDSVAVYGRPTVTIPNDMDSDHLRQLLAVCPNFDPVQHQKMDEFHRTGAEPVDWVPDPSIEPYRDPTADLTEVEVNNIRRLGGVLNEAWVAYDEAHPDR